MFNYWGASSLFYPSGNCTYLNGHPHQQRHDLNHVATLVSRFRRVRQGPSRSALRDTIFKNSSSPLYCNPLEWTADYLRFLQCKLDTISAMEKARSTAKNVEIPNTEQWKLIQGTISALSGLSEVLTIDTFIRQLIEHIAKEAMPQSDVSKWYVSI
jgi:hypothetical protein